MFSQVVADIARTDADDVNGRDAEIVAYAIHRLYHSLPSIVVSLTLMPVVVGVVMWNRVSHEVLIIWLVLALAILAVRYGLARTYARHGVSSSDARRWAQYFTYTSLASGAVWGGAGVLFFVPDAVGQQVFLYVCIVGLAAGSIIATSYWLPAFYAYAVPSITLSAGRLALEGGAEYQGLALLLLMYLGIISRVAHMQRMSAIEAVRLRFENLDLVEQLREQKEVAEAANVDKSRFLAAASHDLRQPLHALGLFVAALNEHTRDADTRALIEKINHSVGALEGLFNALLDISRLDAAIVQPQLASVDLGALLKRLAAEFEPQAQDKNLRFHCVTPDVTVRTDPTLLETVLRNLLGNAIRYTARGSIGVECNRSGAQIAVAVIDTGIGIAPEHQRDVFREFYQLQNPERDRSKGLGLGLAIVDRLTKLLGHPLELQSTPGAGTTFRLTLPMCDAASVGPPTGAVAEDTAGADVALRVLVIDDEALVREAMVMLMEGWGHAVMAVGSEAEARAALEQAPHVVIADYRLRDGRTGAEDIRAIQALWGADVAGLIISGDTAPERLRKAKESGFVFLHKPVQPAKLRAFLRTVGRRHSPRDSQRTTDASRDA